MLAAIAVAALAVMLAGCSDEAGTGKVYTTAEGEEKAMQEGVAAATPDNLPALMMAREAEAIYAQLSPEFKQMVSLTDLKTGLDQGLAAVQELAPVSKLALNGHDMRMWSDPGHKVVVRGIFDENGLIVSLVLNNLPIIDASSSQPTEQTYALPFQEDWFVFWGGDNVMVNYHYEYEDQRYAYDFFIVKDGYTYAGDRARNESYHAFGQPLLAPADGVVVSVVDDIADNVPVGAMNEQQPLGNAVVIDHGGEYSIVAHLQEGSPTVQAGDKVSKGQVIGLAGNSGNSSEPHLHFQVSDGVEIFRSRSLDIQWEDDLRPVQGDTVSGK